MKTVIVGGLAAGASTGARLSLLDESADIVVLERDHYVSFANCGLPYDGGGTIPDRAHHRPPRRRRPTRRRRGRQLHRLELAEAFMTRGMQTTVVERTERLMPWLGRDAGRPHG